MNLRKCMGSNRALNPVLVVVLVLLPSVGAAAEGEWRNDLGVGLGLFSGTGIRFARHFPERIRVALTAGYLEARDRDVPSSQLASVGTEVTFELTHGRIFRVLALSGLGWNMAEDFDPDQDGITEDYEAILLGAGFGLEVRYYRNLSLTVHALVGVDLLEAATAFSPELTLSYGF